MASGRNGYVMFCLCFFRPYFSWEYWREWPYRSPTSFQAHHGQWWSNYFFYGGFWIHLKHLFGYDNRFCGQNFVSGQRDLDCFCVSDSLKWHRDDPFIQGPLDMTSCTFSSSSSSSCSICSGCCCSCGCCNCGCSCSCSWLLLLLLLLLL